VHGPTITLMLILLIHFGKCFEKETCRVTSELPFMLFVCICVTMNLASVCIAGQKDRFFKA